MPLPKSEEASWYSEGSGPRAEGSTAAPLPSPDIVVHLSELFHKSRMSVACQSQNCVTEDWLIERRLSALRHCLSPRSSHGRDSMTHGVTHIVSGNWNTFANRAIKYPRDSCAGEPSSMYHFIYTSVHSNPRRHRQHRSTSLGRNPNII